MARCLILSGQYLDSVVAFASYLTVGPVQVRIGTTLTEKHPIKVDFVSGAKIPNRILIYADDILIIADLVQYNQSVRYFQRTMETITKIFDKWKINVNPNKCQMDFLKWVMVPTMDVEIYLSSFEVKTFKYLGMRFDRGLGWNPHMHQVVDKIFARFVTSCAFIKLQS